MYLNLKLLNGALFLTSKKIFDCLHKKEVDCCITGYTFSYRDLFYINCNIPEYVCNLIKKLFSLPFLKTSFKCIHCFMSTTIVKTLIIKKFASKVDKYYKKIVGNKIKQVFFAANFLNSSYIF